MPPGHWIERVRPRALDEKAPCMWRLVRVPLALVGSLCENRGAENRVFGHWDRRSQCSLGPGSNSSSTRLSLTATSESNVVFHTELLTVEYQPGCKSRALKIPELWERKCTLWVRSPQFKRLRCVVLHVLGSSRKCIMLGYSVILQSLYSKD